MQPPRSCHIRKTRARAPSSQITPPVLFSESTKLLFPQHRHISIPTTTVSPLHFHHATRQLLPIMDQVKKQEVSEHRDVLKGLDAQIARLTRREDKLFKQMERGPSRDEAQAIFDRLTKVKEQRQRVEKERKARLFFLDCVLPNLADNFVNRRRLQPSSICSHRTNRGPCRRQGRSRETSVRRSRCRLVRRTLSMSASMKMMKSL